MQTTSQENQDRMIAAEVLITKFSQSASNSKSEEEERTKQKYINDTNSSGSSNGFSSGSISPSNTSKKIITSISTPTNDSITVTTTISKVDNVNITTFDDQRTLLQLNPPILTVKSFGCSKNERKTFSGIPQSLKQQQQQKRVVCYSSCKFVNNDTEQVRRIIVGHSPLTEEKNENSHECTFPNKHNTQTNNNNDGPQNYNMSNNCPTNNNTNNNLRKKSLPVFNARILKALLNCKSNKRLVYLIHPCNDNFLIRSINKEDFIISFLKLRHKLSGTDEVFNKPQISDGDLLSSENHVWGVLKNDVSIHFFESTPKESKNFNNANILAATEHTPENKIFVKSESSNNESDKTLLTNSVILNSSTTLEPSPATTEKPASTLPLKKRKVADSLLTDYSGTSSSTFLVAHEDSSARSIKSVSQLAEDCIRDRSVFIISPSDVPKFVKSASSNPRDENTNQQLTKSIEIALHQDKDGDLPLHIATVQKDLKMVSFFGMLIQRAGKSVDRFNKKHLTPLHLCVKVKFLPGLKKLIEMGADVNSLDGNGRSALHIAVLNSNLVGLNFMLHQCSLNVNDPKMKPNLNSHDYEGLTLLHTAVNIKHIKLIEKLLEEGAELDSIDFKSGRTPLFHAVENNDIEIVEFLVQKKASVDIPNFAGNTAFLAAYARGYHEISKLLAENGADTRGLLAVEELTSSNPKTTSAVKSQLKNKLVSGKSCLVSEDF